jgi:hypothetical protein
VCLQALFWQQHNFFGVDLTPLHGSAFQGYFSQVAVITMFLAISIVLTSIFYSSLGKNVAIVNSVFSKISISTMFVESCPFYFTIYPVFA